MFNWWFSQFLFLKLFRQYLFDPQWISQGDVTCRFGRVWFFILVVLKGKHSHFARNFMKIGDMVFSGFDNLKISKVWTIYLCKQKWLFCQEDWYFWLFCCMSNTCITHIYQTRSFRVLSIVRISHLSVTSWFDSICIVLARWVNLSVHVYMNMNCSYPTTMYERMFAQIYVFLVEKYYLQFSLNCS